METQFESTCILRNVTPLVGRIISLDIEQIADACIKSIAKLITLRYASLYVIDNEADNTLCLKKHNHPCLIDTRISLDLHPPSLMVMAAKDKRQIVIGDVNVRQKHALKKTKGTFASKYETDHCVITPLLYKDNLVGVLNVSDKVDGFCYQDIDLINFFSNLAGISIGNAQNIATMLQKNKLNTGFEAKQPIF